MAAPKQGVTTAIVDARDGATVRIAGTVEVSEPVEAPISKIACAYAEVYDPHRGGAPIERVGTRLHVRDATALAEVELEHVETELLGYVRNEKVEAIQTELTTVEEKLGELKDRRRDASGPAASAIHREQKQLRRVATLLYAMRAQARGRTHGQRSLDAQKQFIARERQALRVQDGARPAIEIETERLEAVVAEGDTVEIEGLARWRAGGQARGYREAGRRLVITGSPQAPVRLTLTATERRERLAQGAVDVDDVRDARKASRREDRVAPRREAVPRTSGMVVLSWVLAFALGIAAYAMTR